MYCGQTVRPRVKVTIDSLQEVVYEKSIGTKMNNLDLRLDVVSRSCQPLRDYSTLNISKTVRHRGFIPMEHQYEMAYGLSNGHVT